MQKTGVNADGNIAGNITGLPSDPLESFLTTTYSNQKSASVNGAELNVQHMFAAAASASRRTTPMCTRR